MVYENVELTELQRLRLGYQPVLPKLLRNLLHLKLIEEVERERKPVESKFRQLLPKTAEQASLLSIASGNQPDCRALRIGVLFSGGQAAGGHNVISGLFDALKKMNPNSQLFGFKNGPKGLLENRYIEILNQLINRYRNQGGFDLIGSGRSKIETPEQFQAAQKTAKELNLDGIVIIGGDDSNTNAAFLAEYFLAQNCKTAVIGVPKTIDGDLQNEDIEISFGFDTATKSFAETIGNLMRDAISAKKYTHFVKLMGRSASHITLECALKTHPNLALISEEVAAQGKTLHQLTDEICNLIATRSANGKDYGVILIPEGIIEFIPECKALLSELNHLMAPNEPHTAALDSLKSIEQKIAYLLPHLSAKSAACLQEIPNDIQAQLLLERDPHGNVQVSQINTEHLFIEMAQTELAKRYEAGSFKGKFFPLPSFCGYEGRAAFPSNFDAQYCYALGAVAAVLINARKTGYICCVHNLAKPVEEWQAGARSLATMMTIEKRLGKETAVIQKQLVDLKSKAFQLFQQQRNAWQVEDHYLYPGPIQFFGPSTLTDAVPITLREHN